MTKEQEEAIEYIKKRINVCNENADICDDNNFDEEATYLREESYMLETVLFMLKEKDKQINLIKEYAHQEIEHYTETIEDYIDDDKERNKDYIKELKEEREHWKDIERILENKPEELYMNWWKYGLYE